MGTIWAYVHPLGPTLGPMLPCGGHDEAIDCILGSISESFWGPFRAISVSILGLVDVLVVLEKIRSGGSLLQVVRVNANPILFICPEVTETKFPSENNYFHKPL